LSDKILVTNTMKHFFFEKNYTTIPSVFLNKKGADVCASAPFFIFMFGNNLRKI
jgi:hypothetical protein